MLERFGSRLREGRSRGLDPPRALQPGAGRDSGFLRDSRPALQPLLNTVTDFVGSAHPLSLRKASRFSAAMWWLLETFLMAPVLNESSSRVVPGCRCIHHLRGWRPAWGVNDAPREGLPFGFFPQPLGEAVTRPFLASRRRQASHCWSSWLLSRPSCLRKLLLDRTVKKPNGVSSIALSLTL